MKLSVIFPFRAACAVCGGDGATTVNGNAAAWSGAFMAHRNPAVCAAVIAERGRRYLRDHRYRVYCEGREFGKDYTRDKAHAAARTYAANHPAFRYTVRDNRGRFA